ncbi:hypothetical protein HDU87_007624 [Geranomyces variabilis]|uniref:rRNA-processing protein FYV7 n=1 Tax=Geranomyces variabilis TaxID=109894 RepID=A0AAD5XN67_9FUNG|nr:hypothetical protein HDU87_007624 [Geranomyces variabilis]
MPPPSAKPSSSYRGGSNPAAARKKKLGLQKLANNPGIAKKNDAIRRTQIKRTFHRAHLEQQAGTSVLAGADGEIDWELGGAGGGSMPMGVGLGEDDVAEAPVDLRRRLPKAGRERAQPLEDAAEAPSHNVELTTTTTTTTTTPIKYGRPGPPPNKPHHKPNPYAKLVKEAERAKQEKLAAAEEARRLKAEQEAARKDYYTKRNNTRNHLQKKTRKGQPVMANQISHLLDKIQGKK